MRKCCAIYVFWFLVCYNSNLGFAQPSCTGSCAGWCNSSNISPCCQSTGLQCYCAPPAPGEQYGTWTSGDACTSGDIERATKK